jgi:hypothetical protein
MRKVSNYFQRFKINACFEEIKTWRNMYKSTIKAKRMTDLIEKIARKQVYISYYEIQFYYPLEEGWFQSNLPIGILEQLQSNRAHSSENCVKNKGREFTPNLSSIENLKDVRGHFENGEKRINQICFNENTIKSTFEKQSQICNNFNELH